MESTPNQIHDQRLADAWAELQAHAVSGNPLNGDAYRLAFADPEFLLRRETRGIRFQLEMLKPDLAQQAAGVDRTVVVFGSARFPSSEQADAAMAQARSLGDAKAMALAERGLRNAAHYEQARQFARLVAAWSAAQPHPERLFICTGGGPGIMEAANRGAQDAGMPSVALNIALPHEQQANPYVTPELSFKFHYFALRKMHFMMRAVALVAFPGGFGTLDELFETMTLIQTGKCRRRPILLFGQDFWTRLINFDLLIETGMINASDVELFRYVETAEQAWQVLAQDYGLDVLRDGNGDHAEDM